MPPHLSQNHPPHSRKQQLLTRTHHLTTIFTSPPSVQPSPQQILDTHFTLDPKITEHGPGWARTRLPFLGYTFSGRDECVEYFRLLGETLSFEPGEGGFGVPAVDVDVDGDGDGDGDVRAGDGVGVEVGEGGEVDGGVGGDAGGDASASRDANGDASADANRKASTDAGTDAGKGIVTVKGHGMFRSIATGQSWHEEFVWRLSGFDEEGRVGWWEIWADPLSAWLAVGGELEGVRGLEGRGEG